MMEWLRELIGSAEGPGSNPTSENSKKMKLIRNQKVGR
jgi:hypothetical protein